MAASARTVSVLHPVPAGAVSLRAARPAFTAVRTAVVLRERDPDAFRPIDIPLGHGVPRCGCAGPDGLWVESGDRAGSRVTEDDLCAYLSGEAPARATVRQWLLGVFPGTPVAAYGDGMHPREGRIMPGVRGYDGPPPSDRSIEVASADLRSWIDRNVALAGGRVLVRWTPLATLRPRRDGAFLVTDARRDVGLDVVAATPRNWRRLLGIVPERRLAALPPPPPEWTASAVHWPRDGGEDLDYVVNLNASRLRQRLVGRLDTVRATDPGHPERHRIEALLPVLREIELRACLGIAGAEGHETDIDVFRRAVLLEAALAGRASARTGIDVLARFVTEVAQPRALPLPEDDGTALAALAPGGF